MLRVEGDERDDDEHVEADEKAGELLLVANVIVGVDFGVVGPPDDEEHAHFDHGEKEEFVERNEVKRGEKA